MIEAAEPLYVISNGFNSACNMFDKALAHKYRKTSTKWSSVASAVFDVILDAIYVKIIFGPWFHAVASFKINYFRF